MLHGALFGDVDLVTAEHGVDPLGQIAGLGQFAQQAKRVGVDALLGVVEVQADRFHGQRLAAFGVGGKELAQMLLTDLRKVFLQRLPLRP